MKSSNVFQTLKARGYSTGDSKPSLPGIGSPLKKSPYKVDPPKAKAKAEPTPNEVKYAKYGFKSNIVPEASRSYDPATNELTRTISPENADKNNIKQTHITKASPANMKSPAKKKSPVKMDSCASEATVGSNPKRAMRQAKRRGNRGGRKAKRSHNACRRGLLLDKIRGQN